METLCPDGVAVGHAVRLARADVACVAYPSHVVADGIQRAAAGQVALERDQVVSHEAQGLVAFHHRVHALEHSVQQKPHERHALVELRFGRARRDVAVGAAVEDARDLVVVAVLAEQLVVGEDLVGHLVVLQVLAHERGIGLEPLGLEGQHDAREVLPSARGDQHGSRGACAHAVERAGLGLEVGGDGRVDAVSGGVFLPDRHVRLDVDAPHAVEHGRVELARRAVVLGRVARAYDDPSVREPVHAECLELQELQHGGCERLAHAVDLVEEQDALVDAALLACAVHGRDDLGHRVVRHAVLAPIELLLRDEGQAERALARVVRDGIRDEVDVHLAGDLRDDGGLAHARGAEHDEGPLHALRHARQSAVVFREVCAHRAADLLFRLLYVHALVRSFRVWCF